MLDQLISRQSECVPGTIVGWRFWFADPSGKLNSPDIVTAPWPDNAPMLALHHDGQDPNEPPTGPMCQGECNCGINAMDTRSQLLNAGYCPDGRGRGAGNRQIVIGTVDLWGYVRAYKKGWRGEKASVRALTVLLELQRSSEQQLQGWATLPAPYGHPASAEQGLERFVQRTQQAIGCAGRLSHRYRVPVSVELWPSTTLDADERAQRIQIARQLIDESEQCQETGVQLVLPPAYR